MKLSIDNQFYPIFFRELKYSFYIFYYKLKSRKIGVTNWHIFHWMKYTYKNLHLSVQFVSDFHKSKIKNNCLWSHYVHHQKIKKINSTAIIINNLIFINFYYYNRHDCSIYTLLLLGNVIVLHIFSNMDIIWFLMPVCNPPN